MPKSRTTNHEQRITISEWLQKSTAALSKVGIESARLDSLLLLEHGLQKSREWVLAHGEFEISEAEHAKLDKMLAQRIKRTPLAYIIGSKEFYGREFFVNEDVLIPRPESEAMIDLLKGEVLRQAQDDSTGDSLVVGRDSFRNSSPTTHDTRITNHDLNTIIDVGTGSGCLAITAKLLFPDVHVTAVDNSAQALMVAKKNARKHSVQIQFKEMDIANGLPAMPKTRPYVILANLPYVPERMITSEEITREPSEALFSGKDGLNHYRMFWEQVVKAKNRPLLVITESLGEQHGELAEIAGGVGYGLVRTEGLAQLYAALDMKFELDGRR